ncbi:Branched-chain-amino-acid aminotransferase, partial [Plakobranchus ocellatus]
ERKGFQPSGDRISTSALRRSFCTRSRAATGAEMSLKAAIRSHSRALASCYCRLYSSFRADDLRIQVTNKPGSKPDTNSLTFGTQFSDHMFEVNWTLQHGWGAPEIKPLAPFVMHPASKVFHYAQECFEGLKAYRCVDGTIRVFRPMENMKRMLRTAERGNLPQVFYFGTSGFLAFARPGADSAPKHAPKGHCPLQAAESKTQTPCPPLHAVAALLYTVTYYYGMAMSPMQFDGAELVKCMKKLISIDSEWVPHSDQCSLYVRPTIIAIEPTLGLYTSHHVKLFVITSPVGAYYPTGLKPVSLLADPQFVRAWPGGCGSVKLGSNYAPTIAVQAYALKEHNCQQVLWLFGDDHLMTEVGSMNLFIYWINENGEEEMVTPALESGIVLPGITRKSLLQLAQEWNEFKVTEQDIPMKKFVKALKEGRVREVFGAGTACVVSPVNKIIYEGEELHIGSESETQSQSSSLTQRFYDTLLDIQYFRTPHKWMETLDV